MTIYPLDKIAEDVRIALDQNMSSDALTEIGDVDTLALNDIIKSKIVEAIERVYSAAPIYRLDGFKQIDGDIHWGEKESGWIVLPSDMMRLVVFEMSDWSRAVFTAISADDDEYLLQRSSFKGIRGTVERPMCVISVKKEGRVLEFYSCKSTEATITRGLYLPYPNVHIDAKGDKIIEISERCYRAVVYMVAGLVLTTIGEADKASTMLELSKVEIK